MTGSIASSTRIALLESLKASLFDSLPEYPCNVDWNEVLDEAKAQTVEGLVSPVIPVQDETKARFMTVFIRMMHEQDKLLRLLDSVSIPCVIIKGSAAALYYPKPYLRAMGDIDVLVSQERFVEAVNLLENSGYEYRDGNLANSSVIENEREISFIKNGIEIELHHHFSSPGFDIDDYLKDGINRRQYRELRGYVFPMLPEVENGLVLIGHINQHLKNNALGLRQVIDWEMYVSYIANSKSLSERFVEEARKYRLLTLASYITQVCIDHLGLPLTFDMGECVNKSLSDELLDVILNDGNFGRRDSLFNRTEANNVQNAMYRIQQKGFFAYYQGVGRRSGQYDPKSIFSNFSAFVFGFFRQTVMGIKAILRDRRIIHRLCEGKKRAKLYKEIGVRTQNE